MRQKSFGMSNCVCATVCLSTYFRKIRAWCPGGRIPGPIDALKPGEG